MSDMTFGVLPILDIVRYNVGQKEKAVFGFVMPLVGKDLRATLIKAKPLDEVKRTAKAAVSWISNSRQYEVNNCYLIIFPL